MRYYRNELPSVDDYVMVKVTRMNEFGYYCQLLEYDNMDGFLSMSEIAKRRVKVHPLNISDIIPVSVLRIHESSKVVDLSKKKMTEKDVASVIEKYKNTMSINRMIDDLYFLYKKSMTDDLLSIESFYDMTVWKIYDIDDDYQKILNNTLSDFTYLFDDTFDLPTDYIPNAQQHMKKRISKKNCIVDQQISLKVYEEDALNHIKQILSFDNTLYPDYKINIYIDSPPLYKIRIEGQDMATINKIYDDVINIIIKKSENMKCKFEKMDQMIICHGDMTYRYLTNYELSNG